MRLLKHTFVILAAVVLFTTSCSKDNPAPPTSGIMTQGTWKISYFSDNGVAETSYYNGFTFKFNTNGSVTVTKSGTSTTGSWSTAGDESTNKFVLNFGSLALDELNEDWVFTMKSESMVTLEHVNSGGGGTDILTFQKI